MRTNRRSSERTVEPSGSDCEALEATRASAQTELRALFQQQIADLPQRQVVQPDRGPKVTLHTAVIVRDLF
jgi:hypothetical protein